MKKIQLLFMLILYGFTINCSQDPDSSTALTVEEEKEVGAYIRTVTIEDSEFHIGGTNNVFKTVLEVQDEEDGDLFDEIEVYLKFKDNTPDNGDNSVDELFLKTLERSVFEMGPFDLPRSPLEISQQEAFELLNLNETSISCKDQFLVRLNLKLGDGREITTGQSSSKIIAFDDFWSSPFCYTINVVESIDPASFLGTYTMTSISNTELPPSFGEQLQIEITQGHAPNIREMRLRHRFSILQEQPRIFRFTVACDNTIFGKNLLASKIAFCGVDPAILMGPDEENGQADDEDDSVFELWFVEGYLGFDGNCGFGTVPVKYRFSKQ